MGEEIQKERFSAIEFKEFSRRLSQETQLLTQVLKQKKSEKKPARFLPKIGFELEAWLVDKNLFPAPINEKFLTQLKHPKFVHELSRYNFEINSAAHEFHPKVFSELSQELTQLWQQGQIAAQDLRIDLLMMGMLPTLSVEDLSLENMSHSERYHALNEQIMAQRHGQPLHIDIHGIDQLELKHKNVMLESSATSLQIHWDVRPEQAVAAYHTALLLSAPMVALSANSPFLFGKQLWQETRIPLFEQAVRLRTHSQEEHKTLSRVSLGSGFLREGFWELFEENLRDFPPLLPILFESQPEELKHLALHNGTIWRWNRPLVQYKISGEYGLRLEHRVAPAGPTPRDVIAHMAGFVGLMQVFTKLADEPSSPVQKLPKFSQVRENFYQAAQHGLGAKIKWWGEGNSFVESAVQDLLLKYLLPLAKQGLQDLGVAKEEIQFYLDETLIPRVRSGQTGAVWQQQAYQALKGDLRELTAQYLARQQEGRPVHEWSLPC